MTDTDTSTPYPPGTVVRCDAANGGLPTEGNAITCHKGTEFEVESYVAADDDDNDAGGIAFYWGRTRDGGDVACAASVAVLVRTAEEQANRAIPTLTDVTTALASVAIDMEGRGAAGFEADETNTYGKPETGVFEVYGQTDDGLRFGVEVEVKRVWRTDG